MDWVSRFGKTTQCFLVPCPCLPLQLFFSAFVMLNATSMGSSVAEVWVMDGGNVVAEPRHRPTQKRGKAEVDKQEVKQQETEKPPRRRPRGVKMVRTNIKRMKRNNKA